MAEIDDRAFDNMRRATDRAPDRLFKGGRMLTESEYNTRANTEERLSYDKEVYNVLSELYAEDKAGEKFGDLDFLQFLGTLSNEYVSEKFTYPKKTDPRYYSEGGRLLGDVYGGDAEQLKLSAYNFYSDRRDRSNVSIKAPQAEQY